MTKIPRLRSKPVQPVKAPAAASEAPKAPAATPNKPVALAGNGGVFKSLGGGVRIKVS